MKGPQAASFDGQRVLIVNAGNSVSVFRAADLSLPASVSIGSSPWSACSDGINFWVTAGGDLLRF